MKFAPTDQQQSIIGISLLVKLIEDYGVSPQYILAQAGITADQLTDPKAKISIQQDLKFTQAMVNAIPDVDLAFKAGQRFRINAFGTIGLAAAACETVEEAIAFFLRYIRLSNSLFDIHFFKQSGNAVLRFDDRYDLGALKPFYLERDFSFTVISTRDGFPRSTTQRLYKAINFTFECPEKDGISLHDQYQQRYECDVNFSQPYNEIQFDERYLTRRLPQANLLTHKLLKEQCETQELEIFGPSSYTEKIRQFIRSCEEVKPQLEDIANLLHTTTRTVSRKLQAEGLGFQELVAEEVSRKAIRYLQTTELTIEQIAFKLGYSESASFIHAFKRWTGKAPKDFRR